MSQSPTSNESVTYTHTLRQDSILRVAVLYTIYFASMLLLIVGIWKLSEAFGVHVFGEGSPLEWAQAGMMLGTACLFFLGTRFIPRFRELMWLLTAPPLLACTRELDRDIDRLLALGWQLPFGIILIAAAVYAWRKKTALTPQLLVFVSHRSFALMFSGLAIAIPFAQMVGHGEFLKPLFGHAYRREFTRLIEEAGEIFGYWMILVAAVDWLLAARRKPNQIP